MSMKLGSNAVSGIYLGSGAVYKAYRGSNAVFDHAYFPALLSRIASESPYAIPQADIISTYNALTPTVKDDAAYILTPCAYKTGKVYGMIRTGTADFTFSRNSNAMVVGKDGLLQYAPHNLLQRSEEFNNAVWSKGDVTITANNLIAPDGTLTADLVTEGLGTGTTLNQTISVTGGQPYTFSKFIKRGNYDWVRFTIADASGTFGFAWFNLATGVKGSRNSGGGPMVTVNHDMQSVGNGWYRCSFTAIPTATGNAVFHSIAATGNESATRVPSGTRYEWGAQLNVGSRLLDYVQTTSAAVYAPRFSYHPVTKKYEGLLMEKASTNLIQYSEDFNTVWTKDGITLNTNVITAPDGSITADRITGTGVSGLNRIYQSSNLTAGTAYSQSVFVKYIDHAYVQLLYGAGAFNNQAYANFNIQTGVVETVGTGMTATITPYPNGWYRITLSGTASTTLSASAVSVGLVANSTAMHGSAFVTTSSLYVWGAQLEQSAVPTSYIPTLGASATRAADSLTDPQGNVLTYPTGTIIKAIYKIGAGALQTITA